MTTRLRITKHDKNHIQLKALEGITHHGFGTFLENIKPGEIEADAFSKNAMLSANYKSGLCGMEIFGQNIITWGDPSHEIIMPVEEINKDPKADTWLKKIKT